MPEGLIAGFDAGQSHTTCRLASIGSGAPVAEGQGPGVSHLAADGGPARFQAALQQSLQAARRQVPHLDWPIVAAAVGASGIEAGSDIQEQGRELAAAALGLEVRQLVVTGDERTALRGALGDAKGGILVISGTGMIAVGRNAAGQEHRCGGWGWLLDQAGSACDIGRDGLSLSLAMADGRRRLSPLQSSLWQALGINPQQPGAAQAIKARVVDPSFGAAGFAALAPLVAAAAQAGEQPAQDILNRSAEALAELVAAIAGQLSLNKPPVWPAGGALRHLTPLQQSFRLALGRHCPGAELSVPAGDACDGALAMARDQIQLLRRG